MSYGYPYQQPGYNTMGQRPVYNQPPVQQPWQPQPMAQNAPEFQQAPQSGQEIAQAIHRLCDILERKAANEG